MTHTPTANSTTLSGVKGFLNDSKENLDCKRETLTTITCLNLHLGEILAK